MKKYFLKHVTVEGTLKNGDRFITFRTDGTSLIAGKCDNTHPTFNELILNQYPKKYKKSFLALCCNDIKVGDKVINPDFLTEVTFTQEDFEYFTFGRNNMHLHPYYKVIGFVSQEEDWLHEGVVITSNKLIATPWGGSSVRQPIESIDPENYPLDHVWVKGPCGHFH